jgi:pimeloyl-ACP methyl ester carboxylesterase
MALAALVAILGTVATSASEPTRTFDIQQLHVEQFGTHGTAVVLIPGLASGSWVWNAIVPTLEKNHLVFSVTLAGFDGQPPQLSHGLDDALTSLNQLVVHNVRGKPVLVGHSLGGTLALLYATKHSDAILSVVAADALPVFPGTENIVGPARATLAAGLRNQYLSASGTQFQEQQLAYMRQVGVLAEKDAVTLSQLTARSDPKAIAEYAAADVELDFRTQLREIRVPVLEIVPYNPPDYAALGLSEDAKVKYYRSLLDGIARLEVVTVSPARHFVMIDQPEVFSRQLMRFVEGP